MPQRRRIIALFGLGIVLPSVLLGYLALRGVQNDRALVEKERLEGIRQRAERLVRAVDDRIAAIETEWAKVAEALSGMAPADRASALEGFAAANPLVEQIFCVESSRVRLPVAKPLYSPDGRRGPLRRPAVDAVAAGKLRAAEAREFQASDLAGALVAYRQALEAAHDPDRAGMILNGLARVQRKAGRLEEALATYETIVREHGQTVLPGGLPLGPSAALEMSGLWRDLGDPAKSLRASLGLYRSLVGRAWPLEKTEYGFFLDRATGLVEELLADGAAGIDAGASRKEFQELQDEEGLARRRTERIHAFEEGAAAALKARLAAASRLSLDVGDFSYFVSLQEPQGNSDPGRDPIWGLIIDADRLRDDVLRPALRGDFSAEDASWEVKARDGTILLSSGPRAAEGVALRAEFAGSVPDWTLEFRQAPPRLIKSFLLSGRSLYSFAFLLIAGILVFGLILTIRSVSHELELARMKSDFVSTVSHEFKSPLTSIRQLAEMLQSGRVPSEERRRKYYDVLVEQSERLALLTDNILSLAKIESGRGEFRFETMDIGPLLNEIVSSIQERVRHEGFTIGLEIEEDLPAVAADRAALAQAITNLIDNAIKYSGGARSVSVRAGREGPALVIAVRDSGIGIRKEDLDRVFERFYRAGDELTRTVKGSGLGLTLVKEIVEAHRGQVEAESETGQGSVFSIRLPLPPEGDLS